MNIVSLTEHRYIKYAKVAGEIDFRYDEQYISKLNNKFKKEYVKAYIKLLSNQKGR